MLKKAISLLVILTVLPMMVQADGFVQYPVAYHCPEPNQVAIQRDGSFEATTYVSGLSIQWQGDATKSKVGVHAVSFQKAVLACANNAQSCLVYCDYEASGEKGNVIRLSISKKNFSYHKALRGGYGENWRNNQCIKDQDTDCVFQIVEGY